MDKKHNISMVIFIAAILVVAIALCYLTYFNTEPESTPTPTVILTTKIVPTDTLVPTDTKVPTATATLEPSATATLEPTATSTKAPTATLKPTATNTPKMTLAPTKEPPNCMDQPIIMKKWVFDKTTKKFVLFRITEFCETFKVVEEVWRQP